MTQNGFTTGQLSGVSVSASGVVQANYTNGQSTSLGQVAVANFPDQQGLQQVANTNWVQTFASGQPVYGQAGGAGFGTIESGSLEESNVDITPQLVNMITAQRAFQANAEMVSTENSDHADRHQHSEPGSDDARAACRVAAAMDRLVYVAMSGAKEILARPGREQRTIWPTPTPSAFGPTCRHSRRRR